MVNIAKVARVISKATDSLEDARIIPEVPVVTPTAKPLFREAMPAEQRALMPDEGQRVADFYSPTEEFLKDLPIPTKGIRGADILKAIEKEPTIRRQEVAAFGLDIDPQRRYTAEEVGQFVTRNPYRVEAQRPTEFDYTGRYTFQDTQRLELKPNEVQDISYDETIIRAIPAENKAGFVAAMGTHHTPDTIAHVRSSVKNVPSISDRDIYLIEEIQSDLVARGAKPARGEVTYDEAIQKEADDALELIKERYKDLPDSTEIEGNREFLTDLYRYAVSEETPKEYRRTFNVDPSKVLVEKYGLEVNPSGFEVEFYGRVTDYLKERGMSLNTSVKVVQNIRNSAIKTAYIPPYDLTQAIGPTPIKDINEVARLGLQTAIADALSNGQTKVVIPNLEQIVAAGRARPGNTNWDNMTKPGSSFHRMYVTGMQKAIDQIKKDLPDISVATKVEFPFQPRAYYVPSVQDPTAAWPHLYGTIDLDNTVTILDLSAYEGKNLSRLRFADGGTVVNNVKENPIYLHHINNLNSGRSVKNEDGSVSTVRTIIVGDGEYEYLIPTVWNGKILSDEQAFKKAMASGVDWPKAPTGEEGIRYLENLDIGIHKRFAKGGLAMEEQMNLFQHGGLNEEGGMIDEVSGNDVPVGSTRKEVRDDVPAMLSEGEFVFPADVVRYLGLEKLMDLRNQAKAGLAHMEDIGQMGNADEAEEDLPFGMDDIIINGDEQAPVEMAEGGYLPSFMTSRKGDTPIGAPSADDASFVPTLTYETYMNNKGQSTIIPHFGGKPIYAPPVGYTLVSSTGEADDTTTAPVATDSIEATQPATGGGGGGNAAAAMLANRPQREAIDYTKLTDEELADALNKNRTTAGIATGLGFVAPPIGMLMKFATGMEKRNILKEYERRGLEAPEVSEGFLSNLFDNVKNLFGFGDKEEEAAAPAPTRTTGTGGGTTATTTTTTPAEVDPSTATKGINLDAAPTTQRFSDTQLSFGANDTSSTKGTEFGPIGSTQALYDAMVNDVMGIDVYAEEGPGIALGLKPSQATAPTTLRTAESMRSIRPEKSITQYGDAKPVTPATPTLVATPNAPISTVDRRDREPRTQTLMDRTVAAMQQTPTPKTAATTTERSSSAPNAAQARLEALRAKQAAAKAAAPVKEPSPAAKTVDVVSGMKAKVYPSGQVALMSGSKELPMDPSITAQKQVIDEAYKNLGTNRFVRPTGTQMAKGGLAAPKKKK